LHPNARQNQFRNLLHLTILFPLLSLHPIRRLRLISLTTNLTPRRTQRSAITLLIALHHSTSRIRISVLIQFLEETSHRITALIFIFIANDLVPVLLLGVGAGLGGLDTFIVGVGADAFFVGLEILSVGTAGGGLEVFLEFGVFFLSGWWGFG
jgi:hypothetical protein